MDGEIIDALLALLDQRVLVALPVELDGIAVDLLQRLIDRHCANGDWRIAQNPFAGVVDVPSGGEVHHRVGAPADRPHHLLHFLLDGGGDGGVADIGVYFREKVAADDHRLELAVIDVGGNNGAAARDLVAHELRGDVKRHRSAKALAVVMRRLRCFQHFLAAEILALGNVDHLLGDDARPRPFELGEGSSSVLSSALACWGNSARDACRTTLPLSTGWIEPAVVLLDAAAVLHPGKPRARQALSQRRSWRRGRYRARTGHRPAAAARRKRRRARSRAAALSARAPRPAAHRFYASRRSVRW